MVIPSHCSAALLAVLCSSVGVAFAQTAPPGLAECAAIISGTERLACYDRLSERLTTTTPQSAPGAKPLPSAPRAVASDVAATAGSTAAAEAATKPDSSTVAASAAPSMIDAAWGFNPDSSVYNISFYRQNYLQIARYTDDINVEPFNKLFDKLGMPVEDIDSTEARFQISFKARLWASEDRRWGAWAGYTQQSQWQIYNGDISRPFRETNYMPELILSYRPGVSFGGFHWRLFNVGYNHQSNGRSDALSRSWDRIFAEFGIERDNFALLIRPWYRIEEDEGKDDNPDITDYYGHGDITALYKWHDHSFTLMGRGNFNTGKGAAQFTWTTPRLLGSVRGYFQLFSGYGDSLIDYNWNQNAVGVGIALNDLL